MKHENPKRKHTSRHVYLIDMVAGLVSPYMKSLSKILALLVKMAPIIELRVKQTDDKKVAADTFEEITLRAMLAFLLSPSCKILVTSLLLQGRFFFKGKK